MTRDYFAFARETAEATFATAAAKPLTHFTRSDAYQQRTVRTSCGRIVSWREIPTHSAPPTCPRCRAEYDAYQASEL